MNTVSTCLYPKTKGNVSMQVLLACVPTDCSHWVKVLETSHDEDDIGDLF